MADPSRSNDVLYDILRVLQRIESKLEGHEERVKSLEDCTQPSHGGRKADGRDGSADTGSETSRAAETLYTAADGSRPSRRATPTSDDSPEAVDIVVKIPYSQWSINELDRFFNLSLSKLLEARLGDCWNMPDDSRLPLKFFKSNVL